MKDLSGKRFAYFVQETNYDEKKGYMALMAVEGETGYYPMSGDPEKLQAPWYWGHDFKLAQKCADQKNAAMGLSKKDAIKIVLGTMKECKIDDHAHDEEYNL